MKISENCKSWKMEFEIDGLPELNEEEIKAVKSILHSAGDVIATLTSLPEATTPQARETIIGSMGLIIAEAKTEAIYAVDNVLGGEAMKAPLENEFASETLFGCDLKAELIKTLNPQELLIANEHYDLIPEEPDEADSEDEE